MCPGWGLQLTGGAAPDLSNGWSIRGHAQLMQSPGCSIQPRRTALQQVVWRLQQGATVMIGFMTVGYPVVPLGLLHMRCLQKWFASLDLNAKRHKQCLVTDLSLSAGLLEVPATPVQ